MHAIAHGGLRTLVRESALKADSGIKWEEKNLSHRGIEPASAACWSDALPTELHPHRSFTDNDMYTALTLTCSQYRHSHVYSTYSHMKTILTMKHKQITQHWQWYELMNEWKFIDGAWQFPHKIMCVHSARHSHACNANNDMTVLTMTSIQHWHYHVYSTDIDTFSNDNDRYTSMTITEVTTICIHHWQWQVYNINKDKYT